METQQQHPQQQTQRMSDTPPKTDLRHHTPSAAEASQQKRSKSVEEEVKKVEHEPAIDLTGDVPMKTEGSGGGGTTPATGSDATIYTAGAVLTTSATAVASSPSSSRADTKRMFEKHLEFQQAQVILAKVPTLFSDYNCVEANAFLIWLAQLPVAMHRPRPTISEHGWKAGGEVMTVQFDEKVPSVFKKLIDNNFSAVPVLDVHRRYIGMLDNFALVIHTLRCFGVMSEDEKSKNPSIIAMESVMPDTSQVSMTDATCAKAILKTDQADAEMKIEHLTAAGSTTASVPTQAGIDVTMKATEPVHVKGGKTSFMGRPIWTKDRKPSEKSQFGDMWDCQDFRDQTAAGVLQDTIITLAPFTSPPGLLMGSASMPTFHGDVLSSPLVQGSSTLFALELLARHGLHRVPILDSERFVTGLITESMMISLISQYKQQIPSFLSMTVANMMSFLLPHRLMLIDEDAITCEALFQMVKERVNGAAVINSHGVLVDTLSTRDLRGIGRSGLWEIVSDYKNYTRQLYPDKTPHRVHYVTPNDRMIDVLSNMSDGNLHRVFVCDTSKDSLPRPVAVITQRDVQRILLVFIGLTLQGEVRVATA